MPDFDFEAANRSLTGYINLFSDQAAGEGDGSPPWTVFLHAARRVHSVAQSLQERLEECRTEFDQIKSHREEIAARERAMEEREEKVQGAEQTLQRAQQTLQQAEEKDSDTQEKLNQLAENRRQHQDYELQLNTRQMELDEQNAKQSRERQALDEEKARMAKEKEDLARNQSTLEELRKEIESRVRAEISLEEQQTDIQRVSSVLEQQLAPALQKLNTVSAQVQAIEGVIEGTGHLHDRLESAQNTATQSTSIIEQQFATAIEQLDGVSGQVQAIQKFVEDRLQSVQTTSVTEQQLMQQLAPALERLDNVSAQVQAIQKVVEDRLQSAPAFERLENVSAQVQAIEDVVEGTGRLDDRLASIENTTRMTEEEHERMIKELRAEIVTAVYAGEEVQELRQALDDIRNVPEQVEFVKTILTTDIQSLNTQVANLRERNTQLTLQLEAYCNTGGSAEGLGNRRWLAMVNQLRRQLVGINVSSDQGCNFRTILYHVSKAVQKQSMDDNLEVFRVASKWNKWYCWEDVMRRGQDAAVVQGTCSLHQDGACFQVKRVEKGFADLLVFRGQNLEL